ncbi:phospholipase D-like domain-containing protein [Aquibium oceanicum]|uniref:Phospholipase D n=1 Tax=Aquibium oceanicum TaxID=1670800 RepID=A0A1L3SM24_9HYPH|nr:phospholipase D-like domain-containing protein [Aquibium oceanicum]APH70411.1 phospholipase [Aquibium oceanicum]
MEPEKLNLTLQPGRNCWRIDHAERFAILVDAAAYFKAVKEAFLTARHSIFLIGWDFDTRIKFEPEGSTLDGPNKLGDFLSWLVKQRPELNVYVLKWDLGTVYSLGRGTTPFAILGWTTNKRLRFKLDRMHPPGAAHHQKVVVVDDVLAFCGGIDMTSDRWDTRAHLDEDDRRKRPSGWSYGPWHDATAAVDGDAAAALGELARDRWKRATGEKLEPPPPLSPVWPEDVQPTFTNVKVGVARTIPEYGEAEEVNEIEQLYLDAIASARKTIYCESQYFASRTITEAIVARLEEEDGPEIIVVNPESADGFLEAEVMDSARYKMLRKVKSSRHGDRFRIYTPVTDNGRPIYVHAKILIVDDCFLKIGSSNLNNRSMGFDTESDLAFEVIDEASPLREKILNVCHDLVAEHLGANPVTVRETRQKCGGSLIAAIETLRGEGRTLCPFEPEEINAVEEELADSDVLDPEQPPKMMKSLMATLRHHTGFLR